MTEEMIDGRMTTGNNQTKGVHFKYDKIMIFLNKIDLGLIGYLLVWYLIRGIKHQSEQIKKIGP